MIQYTYLQCGRQLLLTRFFSFIRTNFIRTPRLRTITRLKKLVWSFYSDWDVHVYNDLLEFSWVVGRWKSDKQARDLRGQFHIFSHTARWNRIANSYFLAPFYFPGQPLLGNKNNLRATWGWNRNFLKFWRFQPQVVLKRTAQPRPKVTGKVCIRSWLTAAHYLWFPKFQRQKSTTPINLLDMIYDSASN